MDALCKLLEQKSRKSNLTAYFVDLHLAPPGAVPLYFAEGTFYYNVSATGPLKRNHLKCYLNRIMKEQPHSYSAPDVTLAHSGSIAASKEQS